MFTMWPSYGLRCTSCWSIHLSVHLSVCSVLLLIQKEVENQNWCELCLGKSNCCSVNFQLDKSRSPDIKQPQNLSHSLCGGWWPNSLPMPEMLNIWTGDHISHHHHLLFVLLMESESLCLWVGLMLWLHVAV